MKTTYTYCHICEQLCGLAVEVDQGKVQRIKPDKQNPHNWRDFCIKGALAHHSLDHPLRITRPMKRVGDRYIEASYAEAIEDIGSRLQTIMAEHGPDAVGTYVGNPAGFSYGSTVFFGMLANALGTRNQFFTGSVDQNALHVVHDEMFGSAWAALQQDVDDCQCFLLIGTNPAVSAMGWFGHVPDGWKRTLAATAAGAQLIVVDPRCTETAAKATLHVAPLPETDWALLLAVIKLIFQHGWQNEQRFDQINGLDVIRELALAQDVSELARHCDVPLETIAQLAESFASAKTAMAVSRTGPGQGRNGTLTLWLTVILNLITNRIEAPGGLFYAEDAVLDLLKLGKSLFPPSTAVSRVRGSKAVVGYLPIAEIPDEINTPGYGQIKALLINGGNPVNTGPDGEAMQAALDKLELLVCFDLFQRDSHQRADWLIPAVHFLEREEAHVVMFALGPAAFLQMSRQVVPPPKGVQPEWQFFRDLALSMDLPLMPGKRWLNPLWRWSRWIARISGNPDHAFSPRWMARLMVLQSKTIRWRDVVKAEHGVVGSKKSQPFGALFRGLQTVDKKIAAAPRAFVELLQQRLQTLSVPMQSLYPLQLISRRRMQMMNSWTHETSAANLKHQPGNSIELNPEDCRRYGISEGQKVKISSATGCIRALACVSARVRPGVAVMEHGWGGRTFDPVSGKGSASGGVNRNLLVSNRELDPLSGVPRLNGAAIRVEPEP